MRADTRYRVAPADACVRVGLDEFIALYHRPSGITHLLASPAPELLAALDAAPLTRGALLARLAADYEVADSDSLSARLEELVAAGLVIVA